MHPTISSSANTGLTITNPLTLYRALLATKKIQPSTTQFRLAFELQKIYYRLKDYSPDQEYGARLKAISRTVQNASTTDHGEGKDGEKVLAVEHHPIRRNPLFSHLFAKSQERDTLALTKVLTSHEEAMKLQSPKGFLLHGEVGTGKSMLLDLLADSLPNRKKRRWHFNTFMLEIMAQLEQLRKARSANDMSVSSDHSLLLLAKDLIEKSPILFLDEFQLPDRAASKILSNLFVTFFQLGGVLIASSNRMPDELAKASGIDYSAPSRGGLVRKLFGFGGQGGGIGMFPANNEYAAFVDVLKARCDIYDLSGRDWRRREAEDMNDEELLAAESLREEMIDGFAGLEKLQAGKEADLIPNLAAPLGKDLDRDNSKELSKRLPKNYVISTSQTNAWERAVEGSLPNGSVYPVTWESTTLIVYGRKFFVPRHLHGITYWSFSDLCEKMIGPADYITVASTFHTLILDHVPILTLSRKNEARRMITLLDALYEARCKLIIRAEVGPDDLFFPETKATQISPNNTQQTGNLENDGGDAVYPETLSEIYQDQTSPFRPNISTYNDQPAPRSGYDPDQDSDFGPVPGKGNEIGRQVDFGKTGSFTGEDEKFAYKRAASRLWELCSASWHARSDPGWWTPLPIEVRWWERSTKDIGTPTIKEPSSVISDVQLGPSIELDEHAGLMGQLAKSKEVDSPFREKREPPPKIGWTHAWGMMKWGKKAGPWGQGVEGLEQTKNGK